MDYIITHFKDEKELSYEEWDKMFKEDLDKENESLTWNISHAVYSDLSNGRDIDLNGHYYQRRMDTLYDTAKELFDDLMLDGKYDVVLDILKEMTEEEIFNIVSRIKYVNVKENGRLLLKDEKDWD